MAIIELYYDKECPFCNSFANFLTLKKSHTLKLFDAREMKGQMDDFKAKGFDINDGVIVRVDSKEIYQGAEGILFLKKLANKEVLFFDNWFFKKLIYPLIKTLRKIALFLKGKKIRI